MRGACSLRVQVCVSVAFVAQGRRWLSEDAPVSPWRFRISSSSVDGLRSFRLRASPRKSPRSMGSSGLAARCLVMLLSLASGGCSEGYGQ
jgi:hypothetical protein